MKSVEAANYLSSCQLQQQPLMTKCLKPSLIATSDHDSGRLAVNTIQPKSDLQVKNRTKTIVVLNFASVTD